MKLSLAQANADCHGNLICQEHQRETLLTGASSDHRQTKKGDLFVCIKGERHDGHTFAHDAIAKGATAILAERNPFTQNPNSPQIPMILVENSVKALGMIAKKRRHAYASNSEHTVIGITGTAGKTSLKELLAHILSIDCDTLTPQNGRVAKNPLNHNTQIGMPIAMLNASGDENFWVFEAGISHAHDMDELGAILEPDLAIILNVSSGHNEGLGDLGVAHYKARFCKYIRKNGMALISADYADLVDEVKKINPPTTYFSAQDKTIPYFGTYQSINADGLGTYELVINDTTMHVTSHFIGKYGAENCIAAASAAHILNIPATCIEKGIETMPIPQGRFNRQHIENWILIDDSYNSNPLSSLRMLESAHEIAQTRNFYALFGEMKELGDLTQDEHVKLGYAIACQNIQVIYWVGKMQNEIQQGLKQGNYSGLFIPVKTPYEFLTHLKTVQTKKEMALMLFKGSRSNHLEDYVHIFTENCHAL